MMRVRRLGWIYASVGVTNTGKVKCSGILTFNEDGKLREESLGEGIIGKVDGPNDVEKIKQLVLKIVEGEPNFGLRYEIDPDRIMLVDKKTFENVARKADPDYHAELDKYKNLRRPLAAYFSAFRSASTGKVRSKRILVVGVDGKVVYDDEDQTGIVVGYAHKPLTNPRAIKILKEYLASNGVKLSSQDRAYRLNPQSMKNKLTQFPIRETRNQ